MFVRSRTWMNGVSRWHVGKVHWMVEPWTTRCGQEIGTDWILDARFQRHWNAGCKRCGLTLGEDDEQT